MCLDKKIQQLETELNRLKDIRDRRELQRYSLLEKRATSTSNSVSYFPLILVGVAIALLLVR